MGANVSGQAVLRRPAVVVEDAIQKRLDAGFGSMLRQYIRLTERGQSATDDDWQALVDRAFRYITMAFVLDDPELRRWCFETDHADTGDRVGRCGIDIVWNVLFEAVRTRGFTPGARRMTPHPVGRGGKTDVHGTLTAADLAIFPLWVRDREALLDTDDVGQLLARRPEPALIQMTKCMNTDALPLPRSSSPSSTGPSATRGSACIGTSPTMTV